nr:hypothetical protein [Tanacetum cinerariifolium]
MLGFCGREWGEVVGVMGMVEKWREVGKKAEHEEEEYNDEFYEVDDEDKLDDEEKIDDEEDDEVIKELYDDVNVNLGNDDSEMTNADQGALEQQNKADEPIQSFYVSSDFTSKLLNLKNPSLVDNEIASLMETSYLASKMKEAVSVVVQLQTNKLREEAQAENQELINQVALTTKTTIKDQIKAQVSKIMPNIKKFMTESLGVKVLVRSTNQPQMAYAVTSSLSEFELKKILIDKIEANKSINRSDNQKNLYNALVESYKFDKDIITSYGDVVLLRRGQDDQDKDEDPFIGSHRGTKRRKFGKEAESSKDSRSKEKKYSSTYKDASQSPHKSSSKSTHTEEPSHTVEDSDMQQDQKFVTRDNDEQPAGKEFKRKRLIRADELHKFSDGMLNDVRTALYDIVAGIRMEYLPMRKWSSLVKKRARVMVQDIDKQLYQRRLIRNLEMFVGERIYVKDLRLLERTI